MILGHISYCFLSPLPCTIPFISPWLIAECNLLMSYYMNVYQMYYMAIKLFSLSLSLSLSFSTWHLASMDWTKTTVRRDEKHLSIGIWCGLYQRFGTMSFVVSTPHNYEICMYRTKRIKRRSKNHSIKCNYISVEHYFFSHEIFHWPLTWSISLSE